MARKLKVYSWTSFYPHGFFTRTRNCDMFVAATSKAEVARLMDAKVNHLHNLSETGNEQTIEVAMEQPGVVFFWDEVNQAPRDRVPVKLADWKGR